MNRIFLIVLSFFALFLAAPVFAGENTVNVTNEDSSTSVIDMNTQAKPLRNQNTSQLRARLPDGRITPEEAKSIAFEHAPPTENSLVLERTYKGKKIYVVTFGGEEGSTNILIDPITGAVVGREVILN
jgi:uncharacterized membrane protein YkoI